MESEDERQPAPVRPQPFGNGWLGTPGLIAALSAVLAVVNAIGHRWTGMAANLLPVVGMILTYVFLRRTRKRR